ncbi:Methionine synthase (cobalamin-dependent) [Desulfamplus magnetovallimortis]|uniref:Methionine synthase (Cobalamin-dependent) n=1 Tax=Desulfamplus magnetovallimortis TaxID=1246637 RepID=L0R541_9BACT|nr:dihydropteroate synthase [Desulfamplus magnetovallimortis]CCO06640.1 Methionine synthase (cobalamin-dependent) [Desulfamplus magnetovallimortis BW-1]SLM32691.1 Methionine synthase (cobalamin-dependent) [Desulfamplus magnetovallimortis]
MFEVIGERINTSRKNVQKAVAERDAAYIIDDVKKQQEAGANFIDVNAGARIGHEEEDMKWLLDTIQPIATVPLCLDSPDPAILEMAYQMVEKTPMINSISLEKDRFDTMMPFLTGKECKVIALCMDDAGMPSSSDDIVARAVKLVEELNKIGIKTENIYIDPLVQPISTDSNKGVMVLDAVRAIKSKFPEVHITGGLSNISYGLPQRKIINRTFVALMMDAGMDSAIIDPLDVKIMATIKTADMLLGNDNFCGNYLKGVRAGVIES